jgi:hypothetical protein
MIEITTALMFVATAARALMEDAVDSWDRETPLPSPTGFSRKPSFYTWVRIDPKRRAIDRALAHHTCDTCMVYGGDCAATFAAEGLYQDYQAAWEIQDDASNLFYWRTRVQREAHKAQAAFDEACKGYGDVEAVRKLWGALHTVKDFPEDKALIKPASQAVAASELPDCDDHIPF